jgi:nitrate reductase delta subunit
MALLAFKSADRSAGFEPTDAELPDYLPLVLDFAALSPQGERLLASHRGDLELLRRAIRQTGSPYVDVIEAVSAQLPRPGPRDLALIRRTWGHEPPREEVGLEPFAPPEFLAAPDPHGRAEVLTDGGTRP